MSSLRSWWCARRSIVTAPVAAIGFEGTLKLRTVSVERDKLGTVTGGKAPDAEQTLAISTDKLLAAKDAGRAGAREHGVHQRFQGAHGRAAREGQGGLRDHRHREERDLVRRAEREALHRVVRSRRQGDGREDGADREDDEGAHGLAAARAARAGRGDAEEHEGARAATRRRSKVESDRQDAHGQRHGGDRLRGEDRRRDVGRLGDAGPAGSQQDAARRSRSAWRR